MTQDADPALSTLQLQLTQAIDAFRFQIGLLVQFWGFLIAIDALFLGYGFSQGKPLFLLLGITVPVIMIIAAWVVLAYSVPFAFAAVRLERRLLPEEVGVMGTYLRMRFPAMDRQVTALLEAASEDDADRLGRGFPPLNPGMVILVSVDVGLHLALFVLAMALFHGKLV